MAFKLLDFPAEILQQILLELVLDYGVKRALRLRLVCKLFYDLAKHAIYQSGLLDHFGKWEDGLLWQIKNNHGWRLFWHEYLVQRVLTERDPGVGRFVDIREIARRICDEAGLGSDLRFIVQKLCWLALGTQTNHPGSPGPNLNKPAGHYDEHSPSYSPSLSLLSAAAHFNLTELVEELLSQGYCPAARGDIFPPAMQIVAMDGNTSLLERFQRELPEFEELPDGFQKWRGKGGPWSVLGAAIRGEMQILDLALYPPSRADPDSTDYAGQTHGEIEKDSPVGRSLRRAQSSTLNPDVYEFIGRFFKTELPVDGLYKDLGWYSQIGSTTMVRHLLDKGVSTQPPSIDCMPIEQALTQACIGGHDEIVDLLLAHGASPNHGGIKQHKDNYTHAPLSMAASSGRLSIVRRLLDHGALVNDPNDNLGRKLPAIFYAIAVEHTEMVQLLLKRGASLQACDGAVGKCCLCMALELRLDSMADILRKNGVTVEPDHDNTGAPWRQWPMVRTSSNMDGLR